MGAGAISSQVSVVHCRVQRDRRRRADVLVRVLKDEGLKLRRLPFALIEDTMVVDGSRGALCEVSGCLKCSSGFLVYLDGHVRTEIKVELMWVSAARFHESAREGVLVAVTPVREEADVVTLACLE